MPGQEFKYSGMTTRKGSDRYSQHASATSREALLQAIYAAFGAAVDLVALVTSCVEPEELESDVVRLYGTTLGLDRHELATAVLCF